MGNLILAAALQLGAVIIGHYWGLYVHYPGRPPTIYATMAGAALFLLLLGWLVSLSDDPGARDCSDSWVCGGSIGYAILTIGYEPFLFVHSLSQVVLAAVWLTPLLLAVSYQVRAQQWVSVVGLEVFVFTSVAMLTSNANVSDSGSGFFAFWL